MAELSDKKIFDVIRADGRYPIEAYAFLLNEGWPYALRQAYGEEAKPAPPVAGGGDPSGSMGKPPRHVSGRQICLALRDVAVEKWGMLAETVLGHWNIRQTIDFGNMVYLLIRHEVMHKTTEDSLEDFRDVYDFHQAFGPSNQFRLKE
ncbi:MAG: Minf_1886 family protein [Phycisphaerae bacterium]|jgi:uncharacterized repeat protein (TIGR04138 family)